MGLPSELARLRTRLGQMRSTDSPRADALLEDLEIAYEELRVADEEIRTQHDAIQRLVESHQGLRLQHERTMAILPVPVVVTDLQGVIRSVNAAAAMLVEARAGRLLGKPVFALFAASDRQELRRLMSTNARHGRVLRHAATVQTRAGGAFAVEVTASMQNPGAGAGEISWVLLAGRYRLEEGAGAVGRSLTQLAMLPRHASTRADVLHAAVAICREGLGQRTELSVVVGSPLEPVEVYSSSQTAQEWDGAQLSCAEGPSQTCFADGVTTTSAQLRTDPRWPRLAARMSCADVGAVAAAIKPGDRILGTLTAYVDGAPVELEERVDLFAVTLGGVLRELELRDELDLLEEEMRRALSSRAVIDQAKGIIMADRGVDADAAWQHLVHLSSVDHVKLRDVAARIVSRASGER